MVSSHPSSSEGHLRLAEFALEAEDLQEAYRLAAQAELSRVDVEAARVAPRDVDAYLALGHAALKLGRHRRHLRPL